MAIGVDVIDEAAGAQHMGIAEQVLGAVDRREADVQPVEFCGKFCRVPALPVQWNGENLGEGLTVPVLGADTEAVRAELEGQEVSATPKTAVRLA